MRVLITGATGFVGQRVCERLAQSGSVVRAAGRGQATPAFVSEFFPVRDISDPYGWTAALAGCDAVVHLAGLAHLTRRQSGASTADFERTNVLGTANVASLACEAGVRRFVFISSVKVSGESSDSGPLEETNREQPVDAYGRSKLAAEGRLAELAKKHEMEFTVLRPPLVYGPGVKANFLSLLRAVDAGLPLPLLSVRNRRSMMYVGNLVSAIETCLVHPAASNRTFFVSDDHDVSTPELIEAVAASLGKKPRLFRFPPALLHGIGRLAGREEQIGRLLDSLQVDITRIKTELGWRPPFTFDQGLADTARWFRSLRR